MVLRSTLGIRTSFRLAMRTLDPSIALIAFALEKDIQAVLFFLYILDIVCSPSRMLLVLANARWSMSNKPSVSRDGRGKTWSSAAIRISFGHHA
jgi:hypothetical protein